MHGDPSSPRWLISEGANWRALRLSLVFVLDVIEISLGDGDIIDTALINAISTASVARVSGDSDLDAHFATIEAPPPDEMRRPVSVNALAQSLRLPFETVRRRVGRLVRAGLLEIRPAGVIQSAAAVMDPAYLAQAVARYERLRRFYSISWRRRPCPSRPTRRRRPLTARRCGSRTAPWPILPQRARPLRRCCG